MWDGVFDPFGNAAAVTGTVVNPLRFPGQYQDTETALAQNWFRDYDSTIGRYAESDPMGLVGGVNSYAYVGNAPISKTDRQGLVELPPNVPYPPGNIPGGPWTWSPDSRNSRGGDFMGPKQPSGPRLKCTTTVNREGQRYWKTTNPLTGEQQRYNDVGEPTTPEEAHPPLSPNPLPLIPGLPLAVSIFLLGIFYSTPAY